VHKKPKTSSHVQAQEGGIFGTPCFCNSSITPSSAGALSPRGNGKYGFDNTSLIAASMLSFDC
jgi:hypothetical protein